MSTASTGASASGSNYVLANFVGADRNDSLITQAYTKNKPAGSTDPSGGEQAGGNWQDDNGLADTGSSTATAAQKNSKLFDTQA